MSQTVPRPCLPTGREKHPEAPSDFFSRPYLLIGLICLSLGRRSLDWVTPFDLNQEIQINRNVGVGTIEAAFYVSIAIILHGIIA